MEQSNKNEQNYETMYNKLTSYESKIHAQNVHRIQVGIRLLWIIPAIFFVLMFITGSSKLIFLVLWIVSLFLMAIYLIYVEYSDYKLQQQMHEVRGEDAPEEVEGLIHIEPLHLHSEEEEEES